MRVLAVVAVLVVALPAAASRTAQAPADRALATVRALAAHGPRVAGSRAERRAAGLVATRLRALGYDVRLQTFALPRGGRSLNVVGRSAGQARTIVAAHIDSVRVGVGANDNASGVGVMLEVARMLRGAEGVLIAALGAEERVETGSRTHLGAARLVRSLPRAARGGIRVAVVLDMVGVGTRLHVRGIERRPNRSARSALRHARSYSESATYLRDPGWSDHAELTRAGIPAAWIQWRDDACWHSACDRPSRIRKSRLAAALYAAANAAADGVG